MFIKLLVRWWFFINNINIKEIFVLNYLFFNNIGTCQDNTNKKCYLNIINNCKVCNGGVNNCQ